MKARLLGLLFLCCGFLFAISLMAVEDAAPVSEPSVSYIQSMALPPPQPASPDGESRTKTLPLGWKMAVSVLQGSPLPGGYTPPEQYSPYYKQAYYAFHFSDEAG